MAKNNTEIKLFYELIVDEGVYFELKNTIFTLGSSRNEKIEIINIIKYRIGYGKCTIKPVAQ